MDTKLWQQDLNTEYRDQLRSPLSSIDRDKFVGHKFFTIDKSYEINAVLVLSNDTTSIPFKTSTSTVALNRLYGILCFKLKGRQFQLNVYQSPDLLKVPEYADYLFLPFKDLTTGNETYGGGRYIDLKIPKKGNELVIDFNKAYNPYCAYSSNYSCPKVPVENNLNIKILAGIKFDLKH